MDSDEQSDELFNHLTFEFTVSNIDSDSDSESEMSVEYLGSNSDCRQRASYEEQLFTWPILRLLCFLRECPRREL